MLECTTKLKGQKIMKSRTYTFTITEEKSKLKKMISSKQFKRGCKNKGKNTELCDSCKEKCAKYILIQEEKNLIQYYDDYDIEMEKKSIEDITKKAFQSLYLNPTKELKKMKEDIKEIFSIICPFCGLVQWSSMDHYLPKEKMPEYSALGKNLIPCCSICNTFKDTFIKDKDGTRYFFNPYNDEYLVNYLTVNINFTNLIVNFDYIEETPQQLKNHFNKLDLLNRYSKQANFKISETIKCVNEYRTAGGISKEKQIEILTKEVKRLEKQYGKNYWEAILKEELINKYDNLILV